MVGGFMNQFNLYCITNIDAEQMVNPMKHTALFLGFIKGPNVKDWVKWWTNWTIDQFTMGRATTDEYYWHTVIHEFEDAFRDTGTREHTEMCLNHLLMTQNKVDIFLVQFETMAHKAQYPLDAAPTLSLLVCYVFSSSLRYCAYLMDYHWDHLRYLYSSSHHAQTMTQY
jgi:hypothetical protein